MFILKNQDQLTNAINKARKVRPRVQFVAFGHYQVSGSQGFYTVQMSKDESGNKSVECTCKGAEKGLVCYHAAAALSLHIGLARQRGSNVQIESNPVLARAYRQPVKTEGFAL
jgi:hypothetical protein